MDVFLHEDRDVGGPVQDAHDRLPRRLRARVEHREHAAQQGSTPSALTGGNLQISERAVLQPQGRVTHDDEVEDTQVSRGGQKCLGWSGQAESLDHAEGDRFRMPTKKQAWTIRAMTRGGDGRKHRVQDRRRPPPAVRPQRPSDVRSPPSAAAPAARRASPPRGFAGERVRRGRGRCAPRRGCGYVLGMVVGLWSRAKDADVTPRPSGGHRICGWCRIIGPAVDRNCQEVADVELAELQSAGGFREGRAEAVAPDGRRASR